MKLRTCTSLLIGFLLFLIASLAVSEMAHAQGSRPRRPPAQRRDTTRTDTLRRDTPRTDTLRADTLRSGIDTLRADTLAVDSLSGDSLAVTGRKSGIDTVVVYSARDSIIFDVKGKKMRLYNDASVNAGPQKLSAAYIEVDFNASTLYAEARYDSASRQYTGVPIFRDRDQELSANTLAYNFKTQKGTLGAAETKLDEGFYYGEKIKRVDENTFFVKDGRYTTCDAPHPHFFFSSPEMKVVVNDRVFADQVALNIADVPILYLPFGVFFPGKSGRQSGLIIPRWSQTTQRGFTIEDLGYFWVINDYLDSRFGADLYSKGGFTFRNSTRFRLRGVIEQSDLNLTYGQARYDPDEPLVSSYIIGYSHQMPVGRRGRLGGSLNFASQNAIRNTTTRINPFDRLDDITTQRITSDLSFSSSTEWGASYSLGYRRSQNIITDELDVTLPLSFSLPTYTPFATDDGEGALENLSIGYSGSATAQFLRQTPIEGGGFRVHDSRYAVSHSPSVSITPKLGYFSFQPSVSYSESWFFRRSIRQPVGDTIGVTYLPGFYRAYSWSAGASVSTKLFGIVQPQILGINAIRHTIIPTIGLRYSPDFGQKSYGYYDEYFNPTSNSVERYSIFEADQGLASVPGSGMQQLITLDLANDFEAKIAQGDTAEDKTIKLLSLRMNTAYNAAAPGNFRWSEIVMSASTELGIIGHLSGNARFDLYDRDSLGRRIPELLIKKGKGLWSAQSVNLTLGTGFSDQGFSANVPVTAVSDSAAARRARFNFEHIEFNDDEFFGEEVRGNPEFEIPWSVNLLASYYVNRGLNNDFTSKLSMDVSFTFTVTPTTRISSGAQYDFDEGRFRIPAIRLYKDLHCWEMQFDWNPGQGFGSGFYFRIGLKAPQLRDIKLERQEVFMQ